MLAARLLYASAFCGPALLRNLYNAGMHYFDYRDAHLYCEEVPLARIADEVGTPVYIYSERTLRTACDEFSMKRLLGAAHLICYAVKANSNLT